MPTDLPNLALWLDAADAGTITLSGTNTFTGQLTVANGTLSIASIALAEAVTLTAGQSLQLALSNKSIHL